MREVISGITILSLGLIGWISQGYCVYLYFRDIIFFYNSPIDTWKFVVAIPLFLILYMIQAWLFRMAIGAISIELEKMKIIKMD